MVHLTTTQMILLYLAGCLGCVFIGMFISDRLWKNQNRVDILHAYDRGWNAGHAFLDKISTERTEQESSVTILTDD